MAMLGRIGFQIWLLVALPRELSRHDYDFVYVRHASIMFAPAFVCAFSGTRLLSESNTLYAYAAREQTSKMRAWLVRVLERYSLRRSWRVIAISEPLKRELVTFYGLEKNTVRVVGNGCNIERMVVADSGAARRELGIDEHALVIGFVGHLHPWQGVNELIEAFETYHRSGGDAVLLIVGGGDLLEQYKHEVSKRGLSQMVHFAGAVEYERVAKYISCFDIAVAPGEPQNSFNYRIRSPLKVFEYLACGKPVVAGHLESLSVLFNERDVGCLIEPGNVQQLADSLQELATNRERLSYMGMSARRVAELELSWLTVAERLIDAAAE
jgi:glycosyltransferase involved in cell wall biosynthesis